MKRRKSFPKPRDERERDAADQPKLRLHCCGRSQKYATQSNEVSSGELLCVCVWILMCVWVCVCVWVSWSVNACGLTGPCYFDLLAFGLASSLFGVVFLWLKGLINMQMIVCTASKARGVIGWEG